MLAEGLGAPMWEDGRPVNLLRRVLYWQAAAWALGSLPELVAPRWFLERLFHQTPYPDHAYVRAAGAMGIGLAMFMVLVAHRIEDVWWWSWAFVVVDAALATICVLSALFGPQEGSGTLLWWLLGAANVGFGGALLVGMGLAGQERPPI